MKYNLRFLFLLFAAALLLPAGGLAADAPPPAEFATGATLKVTWVQTLIVVLVPALIAGLKLIVPRLPGLVILTLCPILGVAADWLMKAAGLDIGSAEASAALGSAGVYLREVIDQAKKAGGLERAKDSLAFVFAGVIGLSLLTSAPAAGAADLKSGISNSRFYFDSFATAATAEFHDDNYGYGLGVGYQLSSAWAVEARAAHDGFDADGSAVSDVGLRFVVGAPLKRFAGLRPYAFVGAGYHLDSDCWHVDPGAGVELRLNKTFSLFAESGLRATLDNTFDWTGAAGVRLRF